MFENFLEWYNLIFWISILIGVVFIAAAGMGLDSDTFDADADGDIDGSTLGKALSIFGIGKCPASIVIFTAFLVFGGTGIILNLFFAPYLAIVSVGGAFCSTVFLTRIIANSLAKIMPNTESYEVSSNDFIGRKGVTISKTDSTFGSVHIHDQYGSLHKLNSKSFTGTVYSTGTEVLIIKYENNTYYVADPREIN